MMAAEGCERTKPTESHTLSEQILQYVNFLKKTIFFKKSEEPKIIQPRCLYIPGTPKAQAAAGLRWRSEEARKKW